MINFPDHCKTSKSVGIEAQKGKSKRKSSEADAGLSTISGAFIANNFPRVYGEIDLSTVAKARCSSLSMK